MYRQQDNLSRSGCNMSGNEQVIAVKATPKDLKANAEVMKMTYQSAPLPGSPNNNSADVRPFLDAVLCPQVQDVWEHVTENSKLPEVLNKDNTTFIEPQEKTMKAPSDNKVLSIVARTAGIPKLSPSQSVHKSELGDEIIENSKKRLCVERVKEDLGAARCIGYPMIIYEGGRKELSVCGNSSTTTERFITRLETEGFQRSNINAAFDVVLAQCSWLEKPDPLLAVICCSLHVADQHIRNSFQQFQSSLERGQVLSAYTLSNCIEVNLIYEGLKYEVQATKSGPNSYFLVLNGSYKEVETNLSADGSLLLTVDGTSYNTYMREEIDCYRVVIGNKTCVFEKGSDPTILRSPSAGKLLKFLVEEGGHVQAGQPYAKIEIMKKVMTMTVTQSGHLFQDKKAGAILNPGARIARMDLDDASRVQRVHVYTGRFRESEPCTTSPASADNVYQVYQSCRATIDNIIAGYCLPDPYFKSKVKETIVKMMTALKDPSLPLLELQDIILSMSGRIPASVEEKIRKVMELQANDVTSVPSQIFCRQVAHVFDSHAANLQDRSDAQAFLRRTHEIRKFFLEHHNGIRGHMGRVVNEIVHQYLVVESQFQKDNYNECVDEVRENYENKMEAVVATIFSHRQVSKLNFLMMQLIEHLWNHERDLIERIASITINMLTRLHSSENSEVALRARQVINHVKNM